jgi:hypothetical protein
MYAFLRAYVPDPCPRKVDGDCRPCREGITERSAILEFGEGTGLNRETPTCATRAEADALARRQAVEAMGRMGAQGGTVLKRRTQQWKK